MAESRLRKLLKHPSGLSLNIAANIASNMVTAVAFIISVPLFLPYIGLEAYGLVGFYMAVQGLMAALDLGLNITITREFAIAGKDEEGSSQMWDLLRTAEVLYWGMMIFTAAVWALLAGWITAFVNPQGLAASTVYYCVLLMGIPLALQFPMSLYTNGLFGLQRQALAGAITAGFSALRNLGVVGVLHFVSAAPETLFVWHALCGLVQVPILAAAVRSWLPQRTRPPRIRSELLLNKWRFVTGIGIITLVSAILGSIDRLVTARVVSLESFGYYTLAVTVSAGIQWFVQPIFRALFPRLSQVAAEGDRTVLSHLYHQGCQLTSVVVLPIGATIMFFSWEVVTLWQRSEETARNTYVLVSILIAAMSVNALLFVPYALQLAYGWTRLQVIALASSVVVSLVSTIVFASLFGGVGSAAVWLSLNCLLLLTTVPIAHRQLLPGATASWILRDVALPLTAALTGAGIARIAYRQTDSYLVIALQLALAYGLAAVCCVAASGLAREWLFKRLRRRGAAAV